MPTVYAFTPKYQLFTDAGLPAEGYQLFCYAGGTAGGANTKQNTYTDQTAGSANTNPIILDARGECDLWLDVSLLYDIVFCLPTEDDPPAANIWTVVNFGIPQ